MRTPTTIALALLLLLVLLGAAARATHTGAGCTDCASHAHWPKIDGVIRKAGAGSVVYNGTSRSDELLGHHGSDTLRGRESADVLWGDWDPKSQPATQRDVIYGGAGTDFIYGGPGNDAISVHYGRGVVDCGPGRDIYHVARSRKRGYRFRNCEKVDYRPEQVRGGGLKPLP